MAMEAFVVVDGVEGARYDTVLPRRGGQLRFGGVRREEEGARYDTVLHHRNAGIVFDSPRSFHYLAIRGKTWYLVQETLE